MVVGRTVNEIIPEPSLTMVLGKYRQAIAENTIVRWEEISDYPTGRLTGIVSIAPIFDDKGTCTHLVGSVQDITDRKLMEEELRESEEKYHELVKYAPAGIYEYDYETNLFTSVNDVICEYTGYTRDELLTTNFFNILTEESQKLMLARLEKLMAKELSIKQAEVQTVEYCIRKKGGEELWVRLSARYIYESGKLKGSTGVVYNITDRKQAEDMLKESEKKYRELSIIDDLSQLYNSRHFHAQIEIEIERSNRYGQPLTLLLLDLDKFKKFNDKYGHVEGDYVLSRLGQVIKRCLRETDSAYRYGGEEFTIMLPMTTSEEGIVTAKRIQTELRKEAFSPVLGQEVYLTISIGLAQYKPKEEMKAFVHRVDQLMYKGKKNGKGRICSDDGDIQ
jgi:diguanylate cyclase (GGDEF)-like protein/PAS domain S-box-containing protein